MSSRASGGPLICPHYAERRQPLGQQMQVFSSQIASRYIIFLSLWCHYFLSGNFIKANNHCLNNADKTITKESLKLPKLIINLNIYRYWWDWKYNYIYIRVFESFFFSRIGLGVPAMGVYTTLIKIFLSFIYLLFIYDLFIVG